MMLGLYPWFRILCIGDLWGSQYQMGIFQPGYCKLIQVVIPGEDEMCTLRRVIQYQQWISQREVLALCYYPIYPEEPSFLCVLFQKVQNIQKCQQWGLHVVAQRYQIETHMVLAPSGACQYGSVARLTRGMLLRVINLYGIQVTIVVSRIVTQQSGTGQTWCGECCVVLQNHHNR